MIDRIANGVVAVVRAGYRRKAWLSALALVVTLVVAVSYLFLGALRVNPLASSYREQVELPESGGVGNLDDLGGKDFGHGNECDLVPVAAGSLRGLLNPLFDCREVLFDGIQVQTQL